jgi:hypothetical protein
VSLAVSALKKGERAAVGVAFRALYANFGFAGMLGILGRVAGAKLRGEPFSALGPPVDERDRLSRRQVGDLVLLDRAIRHKYSDEMAMSACRTLTLAGGVVFLDAIVPHLAPDKLGDMAGKLVDEFFNAEGRSTLVDANTFRFDVTRCRFVDLLSKVDAAHLVPLFCEVDSGFFDGKRRPVLLQRTQTLATGGSHCDFVFTSAPHRDRSQLAAGPRA